MRHRISSGVVVGVFLSVFAAAHAEAQTAPRSYAWQGQVVSYDATRRVLTVTAPFKEHVSPYVGNFKAGDSVLLTWSSPRAGETDAIIHVARFERGSVANWGYVLPVVFASADRTARKLTFSLTIPATMILAPSVVAAGNSLRVTAPFDQPRATAALLRVEAARATPRAYDWFAQLVSFDATRRVATVTAPFKEHISRYVGTFKTGDSIMLTWSTPRPGDTDSITYVGRFEPGSLANWGYVLPATFVSADPAARKLTFSVTIPLAAALAVREVAPGGWIKVTSPFEQPRATAAIQTVSGTSGPPAAQP